MEFETEGSVGGGYAAESGGETAEAACFNAVSPLLLMADDGGLDKLMEKHRLSCLVEKTDELALAQTSGHADLGLYDGESSMVSSLTTVSIAPGDKGLLVTSQDDDEEEEWEMLSSGPSIVSLASSDHHLTILSYRGMFMPPARSSKPSSNFCFGGASIAIDVTVRRREDSDGGGWGETKEESW